MIFFLLLMCELDTDQWKMSFLINMHGMDSKLMIYPASFSVVMASVALFFSTVLIDSSTAEHFYVVSVIHILFW